MTGLFFVEFGIRDAKGTFQPQHAPYQSPGAREIRTTHMQKTVLLIDDNAIQAATRQTILKRAGYFVIPVLNPERALQQFRENEFPSEVNLVITDHVMPGMNGSQFVRELRTIHPHLPVLVISGLDEAEEEYKDMNVLFRLKPLLPDNLLASVDRLVHPAGLEQAQAS